MLPKFHFTIERWKYNPTFELYVSNMGHIRNKSKADIAPRVAPSGYLTVKVGGSINAHMLLHRVVMLTWKPTPEAEKLTVDHLDHNKRNNSLSNLEWVLEEENRRRAKKDQILATEVIDHHLVEIRVDAKSVSGYILTANTTQHPSLTDKYQFENINSIIAFIQKKRAEGVSSLNAFESKAQKKLKNKINGMLSGSNLNGKVQYMGITITPIVKE